MKYHNKSYNEILKEKFRKKKLCKKNCDNKNLVQTTLKEKKNENKISKKIILIKIIKRIYGVKMFGENV